MTETVSTNKHLVLVPDPAASGSSHVGEFSVSPMQGTPAITLCCLCKACSRDWWLPTQHVASCSQTATWNQRPHFPVAVTNRRGQRCPNQADKARRCLFSAHVPVTLLWCLRNGAIGLSVGQQEKQPGSLIFRRASLYIYGWRKTNIYFSQAMDIWTSYYMQLYKLSKKWFWSTLTLDILTKLGLFFPLEKSRIIRYRYTTWSN